MTIYEIAKLAGVSAATVSRVVNNCRCVSKSRKEKVQEIVQRYRFKPDPFAQFLGRRNKSQKRP